MMKKLISIAMILALATSVGCSNSNETVDDNMVIPPVNDQNNDLFNDDTMNNMTDNLDKTYKDGVYRAEFTEYNDGYKDYVEVTIRDGKIDKVMHDGLSENGELKSLDEDLKSSYMSEFETYPAEYMPIYSKYLVDNQSIDNIEIHKGTHDESDDFVKLARKALDSAKTGLTDTMIVDNSNIM